MSDYSVDPGATIERLIAERDAALVDVKRLDNALNVTDAAATKWLSELTKARELFELILDDPRLVVAMSSDILVPIKSLLSAKPEPFESKVSTLQQRLTAADERADVLEGLLLDMRKGDHAMISSFYGRIDAALRPTEGGGDEFAHDRAYRNGLMQGYNLALNGSEKEYQDAVARYSGDKDEE